VRAGDLRGAVDAYGEADRRAPFEDKPEIANRLGWLTKELGDSKAAGRYFARGRGDAPRFTLTLLLIAITSIVSLVALFSDQGNDLFRTLQLDKFAVADGEYYRLWSVTLLHADILHLAFNMYALYLAGSIVERWYGPVRFLVFYLACAAAGSAGSFVFGGDIPSVGASGAVFGLFGVLLAAGRVHHPVDRESRGIVGQLMGLVIINLVFGLASGGAIDNAAHIGGLIAGLWLGALVPPTGVPTMSSLWHRPGEKRAAVGRAEVPVYLPVLGVAVVAIVVAAGIAVGTSARSGSAAQPGIEAASGSATAASVDR
jgi:membrane associated rhomboid family serine protease